MTTMNAIDASPPPLDPSLSDEELMGQLAAGRQEALGPLHGRYATLVFNLAARTLDRATADEVVQDVFVAVWRKAGTFDPARGSFRAWVLQIAHFRVINELRQRGRHPRVEPEGPAPRERARARARADRAAGDPLAGPVSRRPARIPREFGEITGEHQPEARGRTGSCLRPASGPDGPPRPRAFGVVGD
jgi:RNA polymerase sigma-70 factor (ECF subfamily)